MNLKADNIPLLSREEKEELYSILKNGHDEKEKSAARQKLVLSCVRIPINIANQYRKK